VDHGLTDRTPEIVRRFEPSLGYIREENGGRASGIQHWHSRMAWPNYCLLGSAINGCSGSFRAEIYVSAGTVFTVQTASDGCARFFPAKSVAGSRLAHLDCRLRVEIVQVEADQFRLMFDAGAPWQTARGK